MQDKFMKIRQLGDRANFGITTGRVEVTEKVDGCFVYETEVETDHGPLPIGYIVNHKLPINVKSIDVNTGELSYKPILNYWKNGKTNEWLRVTIDGPKGPRTITVTKNHNVYDGFNYFPMKAFNVGDEVCYNTPELQHDQEMCLLGSLIGDGSFSKTSRNIHFSETHCEAQLDYLEFKMDLLRNLGIHYNTYVSAYDKDHQETVHHRFTTHSLATISKFCDKYNISDCKKHISPVIVDRIDEFAIAIWYCDDGSVQISDKQRPRVTFHTQAYSEEECQILQACLNKFGIESTLYNYEKGFQIALSADSSERLFEHICKFIIPCMQYKLPEEYRHKYETFTFLTRDILPCKILKIEEVNEPHIKYDIEVADNHNYFANGMLVSNSNFSWKVKPDGLEFRSHNVVLGGGMEFGEPWKAATEFILAKHAIKPFDPKYTYFGESLCKPHRIQYGKDVSPFIGFAILNNQYGIYVQNWREIYESYDVPTVPGIVLNDPTIDEIKAMVIGKTGIVNREIKKEGIVLSNHLKQLFAKVVSDEYKETAKISTKPINEECMILDTTPSIVATYCTEARVIKKILELRDESAIDISMEMMTKLPKIVIDDIFTEEIIDISTNFEFINFKKFRKLVSAACARILKAYLLDGVN